MNLCLFYTNKSALGIRVLYFIVTIFATIVGIFWNIIQVLYIPTWSSAFISNGTWYPNHYSIDARSSCTSYQRRNDQSLSFWLLRPFFFWVGNSILFNDWRQKWRNVNIWVVWWSKNPLYFPKYFCEGIGGLPIFQD